MAGGRVTTIGGGVVLGASGVRLRRKRPWTIETLSARRAAIGRPRAWAAQWLKEAAEPLPAEGLARRAQLPAGNVPALLAELAADGTAVELAPGQFVHRDTLARTADAIAEAVGRFHDANPIRLGIEQSELADQAGTVDGRTLFDAALAKLLAEGKLQRQGTVIGSRDHAGSLAPADRALVDRIEKLLREAHLEPPLPEALSEGLREPPERIDAMIRLLVDAGLVLRLDRKVAMHRDAVEAARKVVLDLFGRASSFETVQFRDALGVSRKYAVPLLDYFDTARWTVRSGSRRRPGAKAKEMLGKT